jgi:hypothetical protein
MFPCGFAAESPVLSLAALYLPRQKFQLRPKLRIAMKSRRLPIE